MTAREGAIGGVERMRDQKLSMQNNTPHSIIGAIILPIFI